MECHQNVTYTVGAMYCEMTPQRCPSSRSVLEHGAQHAMLWVAGKSRGLTSRSGHGFPIVGDPSDCPFARLPARIGPGLGDIVHVDRVWAGSRSGTHVDNTLWSGSGTLFGWSRASSGVAGLSHVYSRAVRARQYGIYIEKIVSAHAPGR